MLCVRLKEVSTAASKAEISILEMRQETIDQSSESTDIGKTSEFIKSLL